MQIRIPFNRPAIVGKELEYIREAVEGGNLAGDGAFTRRCSRLIEERTGAPHVLLTPSCTSALELAADLCNVGQGDEVILPAFTFVTTASAFARRGARPVFVDIREDTLNLDEVKAARAFTERTRAIVPVHYAGVGCAMDRILETASSHNVPVVEDAAHALGASYRGRPLGALGELAAFSFHETKNVIAGQAGALCVNRDALLERAEILRDKGTNRAQFFRGQADKYTWVELGSSHVLSELSAAYLLAQLEQLDAITERRKKIDALYRAMLAPLAAEGKFLLPQWPAECQPNYHIFYLVLASARFRDELLGSLNSRGIWAVFHYVPLHTSPVGRRYGYKEGDLPVTEDLAARVLRLPVFYDITPTEQREVARAIYEYFGQPAPEFRDLPF